uniref:Uncharacterized protein n=1 Tax=viral metagenome TaxID=1070528 RepID=A0A6M3XU29_9ZZZZ
MTQHWTSFIAWVEYAADKIATILSEGDIWAFLTLPIEWAQAAWNWVIDAFQNVWNVITDWWEVTKTTVLGWIDLAVEGFSELKTAWHNFWTATLPNLLDWFKLENWWVGKLFAVDGLIGSKLTEWFPFYDELVMSIDGILTFFSDPAKAVYELFDYVIDRFWEDSE